jgi:hypothetical protein
MPTRRLHPRSRHILNPLTDPSNGDYPANECRPVSATSELTKTRQRRAQRGAGHLKDAFERSIEF